MPFFKSLGDSLKKAGNAIAEQSMKAGAAIAEGSKKAGAAIAESSKKASASMSAGLEDWKKFLSMDGYLDFAADTLEDILSGSKGPELVIPQQVLAQAKGIVVLSEYKAGFLFSANGGIGVVLARLPDNTWSGPCSITCGGMSGGALVGASAVHSVLVLNTDAAVEHFSRAAHVRLGGNISVAAGPVGRDLSMGAGLSDRPAAPPAAVFSYSFSKGVFAGVALTGTVISPRWKDNMAFYGGEQKRTAAQIIRGEVKVPAPHAGLQRIYKSLGAMVQGEEKKGEQKAPQQDEQPGFPVLERAEVTLENASDDDDAPKPADDDDDDAPKPEKDPEPPAAP